MFSDEAVAVIYEFSRGIPRIINNLCEHSLLSGYGKQMKEISPEIVREVALDLRLGQVTVTSTEDRQRREVGVEIPLAQTAGTNRERSTELQPRVGRQ
jgi:hypothetical protein